MKPETTNEKHLCERALEKAAKKICTIKCGLCPAGESDFSGCPTECNEEVMPWQCWASHFKIMAADRKPPETTAAAGPSRPAHQLEEKSAFMDRHQL